MVVRKVQLTLLASLGSIAVLAGCGEESSTSAGNGAPADAGGTDPTGLLLTSGDLPGARTTDVVAPELCGPLPVLEAEGETAMSETLESGDAQIVEAVGVFDTSRQASSAYDRLNHPKRLSCIGKAISIFGTADVEQHRARELPSGDEGTVVRFVAIEDGERIKGYSDVVALRVGQCTASLLIAIDDSNPQTGLSGSIGATAAGLLSPACDAPQ